jgi:hypothetical protein
MISASPSVTATMSVQHSEDPMNDIARMAPLGSMVSKAESGRNLVPQVIVPAGDGPHRPSKRPRFAVEHEEADPIDAGICTEAQGRELFDT